MILIVPVCEKIEQKKNRSMNTVFCTVFYE